MTKRRQLLDQVIAEIDESMQTKQLLRTEAENITLFAREIVKSLRRGGKLVLFGNGGSAADAQHIAAEFTGRYLRERKPMRAVALTTNTSSLTAIANDYGYDHVFERPVEALVEARDIVVGISTSGDSENVIRAMVRASKKRAYTVGLTGKNGGRLANSVDLVIRVPSAKTPRIQECHILIGHIVSAIAEREENEENA